MATVMLSSQAPQTVLVDQDVAVPDEYSDGAGRGGDEWWRNYEVVEDRANELGDHLEMLYMYSVNPLELTTVRSTRRRSTTTPLPQTSVSPVSRPQQVSVTRRPTTLATPPPTQPSFRLQPSAIPAQRNVVSEAQQFPLPAQLPSEGQNFRRRRPVHQSQPTHAAFPNPAVSESQLAPRRHPSTFATNSEPSAVTRGFYGTTGPLVRESTGPLVQEQSGPLDQEQTFPDTPVQQTSPNIPVRQSQFPVEQPAHIQPFPQPKASNPNLPSNTPVDPPHKPVFFVPSLPNTAPPATEAFPDTPEVHPVYSSFSSDRQFSRAPPTRQNEGFHPESHVSSDPSSIPNPSTAAFEVQSPDSSTFSADRQFTHVSPTLHNEEFQTQSVIHPSSYPSGISSPSTAVFGSQSPVTPEETLPTSGTTRNPFLAPAAVPIVQQRYSRLLNRYSLLDEVNTDKLHNSYHAVPQNSETNVLETNRLVRQPSSVGHAPFAPSSRTFLNHSSEETATTASRKPRKRRLKTTTALPTTEAIGHTDTQLSNSEEVLFSQPQPQRSRRLKTTQGRFVPSTTTVSTTEVDAITASPLPADFQAEPLSIQSPASRQIISGSRSRSTRPLPDGATIVPAVSPLVSSTRDFVPTGRERSRNTRPQLFQSTAADLGTSGATESLEPNFSTTSPFVPVKSNRFQKTRPSFSPRATSVVPPLPYSSEPQDLALSSEPSTARSQARRTRFGANQSSRRFTPDVVVTSELPVEASTLPASAASQRDSGSRRLRTSGQRFTTLSPFSVPETETQETVDTATTFSLPQAVPLQSQSASKFKPRGTGFRRTTTTAAFTTAPTTTAPTTTTTTTIFDSKIAAEVSKQPEFGTGSRFKQRPSKFRAFQTGTTTTATTVVSTEATTEGVPTTELLLDTTTTKSRKFQPRNNFPRFQESPKRAPFPISTTTETVSETPTTTKTTSSKFFKSRASFSRFQPGSTKTPSVDVTETSSTAEITQPIFDPQQVTSPRTSQRPLFTERTGGQFPFRGTVTAATVAPSSLAPIAESSPTHLTPEIRVNTVPLTDVTTAAPDSQTPFNSKRRPFSFRSTANAATTIAPSSFASVPENVPTHFTPEIPVDAVPLVSATPVASDSQTPFNSKRRKFSFRGTVTAATVAPSSVPPIAESSPTHLTPEIPVNAVPITAVTPAALDSQLPFNSKRRQFSSRGTANSASTVAPSSFAPVAENVPTHFTPEVPVDAVPLVATTPMASDSQTPFNSKRRQFSFRGTATTATTVVPLSLEPVDENLPSYLTPVNTVSLAPVTPVTSESKTPLNNKRRQFSFRGTATASTTVPVAETLPANLTPGNPVPPASVSSVVSESQTPFNSKRRRRPVTKKSFTQAGDFTSPTLASQEAYASQGARHQDTFATHSVAATQPPIPATNEQAVSLEFQAAGLSSPEAVPKRRKLRRRKLTKKRSTQSFSDERVAASEITNIIANLTSGATSAITVNSTITTAEATTVSPTTSASTTPSSAATTITAAATSTTTVVPLVTTTLGTVLKESSISKEKTLEIKSGLSGKNAKKQLLLESVEEPLTAEADESGDDSGIWFSDSAGIGAEEDSFAHSSRVAAGGSLHKLFQVEHEDGAIRNPPPAQIRRNSDGDDSKSWFGLADDSGSTGADSNPEKTTVERNETDHHQSRSLSESRSEMEEQAEPHLEGQKIVVDSSGGADKENKTATFSVSSSTSVHTEVSKSRSSQTAMEVIDAKEEDLNIENGPPPIIVIDKVNFSGEEPREEERGTSAPETESRHGSSEKESTTSTTTAATTTEEDTTTTITTTATAEVASTERATPKPDRSSRGRTTTSTAAAKSSIRDKISRNAASRNRATGSGGRSQERVRPTTPSRRDRTSTTTSAPSTTEEVPAATENLDAATENINTEEAPKKSSDEVNYFGEDEVVPSSHSALDGPAEGELEPDFQPETEVSDGEVASVDVSEHNDHNDRGHGSETAADDDASRWELSPLSDFSGPIRESSSFNVEVLSKAPKQLQLASRRETKSSRSDLGDEFSSKRETHNKMRNFLKIIGLNAAEFDADRDTTAGNINGTETATKRVRVIPLKSFAFPGPPIKTPEDIAELFEAVTSTPIGASRPFQPPPRAAILRINSTTFNDSTAPSGVAGGANSAPILLSSSFKTQALNGPTNCSRSDRNICPMNEEYPRNLVDLVVKQHEESVKRLWQDLEAKRTPAELFPEDSERKGEALSVCDSSIEALQPGWARDATTGKWMIIINTSDYPQILRVESCLRLKKECLFISPYYKSSCVEHYSAHRMVAIRPNDPASGPIVAIFKFPCGCSCKVGMLHGSN